MKSIKYDILQFNGRLGSLKYLCDTFGMDVFSIKNNFNLNRVKSFYNSSLPGNCYIEDILLSDNFDKEFCKLFSKNSRVYKTYDKLINELEVAEKNYCNIGLERVKKILSEKSINDITAKSLKIALEIEEVNINAKKLMSNFIYQLKEDLILKLIALCEENNINYGFSDSDILRIPSIVYFDLVCGQISWHTLLDKKDFKCYGGKWNETEYTTLRKIEDFVQENYL